MIAFAHRPEVNPRDIRHLPNNDGSDYRLTTYPSPHHPPGPFPNDTSRYLNIVQGRQGRLDKKKKDPTDREQSVHIQSPITLPERHGLENQHVRVFGEKGERCGVLHFANGWPQQATGMGVRIFRVTIPDLSSINCRTFFIPPATLRQMGTGPPAIKSTFGSPKRSQRTSVNFSKLSSRSFIPPIKRHSRPAYGCQKTMDHG